MVVGGFKCPITKTGHEEVIKTLLEKHVNIVLCDHVGREALEFALSVNMKIIGGFTGKPINAIYKLLSKDIKEDQHTHTCECDECHDEACDCHDEACDCHKKK